MNLLIDLGNSRVKWAFSGYGTIEWGGALTYRAGTLMSDLSCNWCALPNPEAIALVSVTQPQTLSEILSLCADLWPGVEPRIAQSSQSACGIQNAYRDAHRLGGDRWVAMIGAHRRHAGKLCVVDCGTAITIDAIDATGRHVGGLIAPGLQTMRNALLKDTANLHEASISAQPALADETSHAIANGILLMASGFIESVSARLLPDSTLILTGGDAEALAKVLPMAVIVDDYLIFQGLQALCIEDGAP